MRRSWAVALSVASLVGASSAIAAGNTPSTSKPGSTSPSNPQGGKTGAAPGASNGKTGAAPGASSANKSYEATKHLAVINAGLKDAQVNSQMLADISSDSRSYDRAHGEVFYKNIQESVTEAEGHLAHLQPLATTSAEKSQLQQVSQRLNNAKGMMQPMGNQLDNPKTVHDSATKMQKEFSGAMAPLKQVAQEMNSKVHIG